jgi:2-phosphosulfolactate phosphatase
VKIQTLYGVEGARKATGLVIVVDILRAATMEAYALASGAKEIIPVATKEEAFELKKQNPDYLLAGEEQGVNIPNFDYGNSPSEMLKTDLKGKTIIHRSTLGTQGLVNAIYADRLIFGSFVTLSAIVRYIRHENPDIVSIVVMDDPKTEDDKFAQFLIDILNDKHPEINTIIEELINQERVEWYFNKDMPQFPEDDFHLAFDLNRFDFICLVEKENGQLVTLRFD